MCALNTVCWHSFQQSIFIQRGPDAQVKITNLPGCVMNLCVCVCEEKWVRTFKIQDKISHIEASFLLQTVLICILQRPWLVFQIWWWIIHLHSRGFVCERVCVCVEDFAACFLQVSPPYQETEKPTSPSTSRTSRPARRTRSTRPRTPNNQVAHTERTRRWTVVVFLLWVFFIFYYAMQQFGAEGRFSQCILMFCTVGLYLNKLNTFILVNH